MTIEPYNGDRVQLPTGNVKSEGVPRVVRRELDRLGERITDVGDSVVAPEVDLTGVSPVGHTHVDYSLSDHDHTEFDVLSITDEIQFTTDGSNTDPVLTWDGDQDTGIFRKASDQLGVTAGGHVAYFSSAGLNLADGDWFRATGDTGLYLETHALGWYAVDGDWMRLYGGSRTKGLYSNGGRIAAYYDATGQSEAERKSWVYSSGRFECNAYNGISIRNVNDSGTVQLRPASGILYIRNHDDSAYYPVYGGTYTVNSSGEYKQDIVPLASSLSKVKAMNPVSYRMKKETHLSVAPQSERRQQALIRLQTFHENRGEEPFHSDELVHECGRDCDGSVEDRCLAYRNWEKGQVGLVAEELAEVAPEVVSDSRYGGSTGVDTYALITVLVKAVQELSAEVDALKAAQPDAEA